MAVQDKIILKPEERVIRTVRRVPIIDIGRYAFAAFFLLLPFFLIYPLLKIKPWGIAIGTVLFCIGLFLVVRTLFLWYHNVFIVTTHRIIDLDQRGFFDQVASQSSHEKIQDVSFHTKGFLPTLFRFGTITLKTGWGSVELVIPHVAEPARLQRLILDVQDAYMAKVGTTHEHKKTYDTPESAE